MTIKLIFRSAKDGYETSEMHVYNNNIEIMPGSDSYEDIKKIRLLAVKTEATLGSQIADLSEEVKDTLTHLKKVGSQYCCR